MPSLALPDVSLYYEVHGDAGPWLVFVHGAGGNHLSWWQQVPAFADRHRCVILAQRGWGRSPAATPDPARFATDLTALLDHLEVERAALVGQSMGGWSVVGCALTAPARISHLVLTGTIAGLSDDAMLAELARIHAPGRPFDPHLALAPDYPARAPAGTFLYDAIAGLNPPPPPTFLAALVGLRYSDRAHALTMPVHFIAGERDQLFPPALVRRAHAMVPGATLEFVPDAGHSVYFEAPDTFNALLRAALTGPTAPAR
jgi:3-oxoadipate enol-lactonase